MKIIVDSVAWIPRVLVSEADRAEFTRANRYSGEEFPMYIEGEKSIGFPRSAAPKWSISLPVEYHMEDGRPLSLPASQFRPRPGQEDVVRAVTARLTGEFLLPEGLLTAGCGKGKTVMGSEVALRVGRSTCVVVHKEYLGQQWVDALQALCPTAKIGHVRRERCDTGEEFDFVIASTQSLTSATRKYPEEFYKSFGLLILDEVHRYGADTWQRVLQMFPAKRRLGLTATVGRFDGLWDVVTAHIGEPIASLEADTLEFKVYAIGFPTTAPDYLFEPWMEPKMRRAKIMSFLAEHRDRNRALSGHIVKAHSAGRKILVISDRKVQLEALKALCIAQGVPEDDVGMFVGSAKKAEQEEAKKRPVIMTTYQMSEEGLDIETLDTLVMGTPRAHVVQTVGRILREFEGKKLPLVFDPIDIGIPEAWGWSRSRTREYASLGATIEEVGDVSKQG